MSATLLAERPSFITVLRVRSVAIRPAEEGTRVTAPGKWRQRQRRVDGEDLIRSLYLEHGRSLLAYATRLTGDQAAAEDVVQETLLRAWKHAAALINGTGSVRGWLLTVARNIVTDRVRARAVRPYEVEQTFDAVP